MGKSLNFQIFQPVLISVSKKGFYLTCLLLYQSMQALFQQIEMNFGKYEKDAEFQFLTVL